MSGAGIGGDGGAAESGLESESGPESRPESGFESGFEARAESAAESSAESGSGNVAGSGSDSDSGGGPASAEVAESADQSGAPGVPDGPRDAAAVLQRRYRRALMLLPRAYRAQRGEEMLGVLMDSAPEQQRWPKLSEVLSLATHSVRVRSGVGAQALPSQAVRPLMRAVALLGTLYLSFLVAVGQFLGLRWNWGIYGSDINYSDLDGHHHTFAQMALLQVAGLLWLGAFAAMLLGRQRFVQILGWMLVVLAASQVTGAYTALATVPPLIVAAAVIATGTKEIAPAQHLRRWFAALAAVAAIVVVVAWYGRGTYGHPAETGPLVAVAAAVAAVAALRGWRRAEWAVAAAVVGGIAGIQRALDANHYPDWQSTGLDPRLRLILIGEAVLILVAVYAIVRQRRQKPTAIIGS
ncbi:hypothetical protein [Catenulispora rubra]|uniref:hypothetical protein n=1 Tax=Catenulispora rubra TaxID=280293 RepID=UPI001892121F|nr:hypothetical protein [Catenulispora rubra]